MAKPTGAAGPESARRALEMLFCFRRDRPVATVKQLASELDLPLPSAHRYVALLRSQGLVTESDRGHYHLTHRVVLLAEAAWVVVMIVVCRLAWWRGTNRWSAFGG